MKTLLRALALTAAFALLASRANAAPILQLDILGGTYDAATQTIVSSGPDFTLVALLTPNDGSGSTALADTYYISAALTPATAAPASLGSFSFAGTSYNVTSDLTYGTPPIESDGTAATDAGDLASHNIFPTWFRQFSFTFSSANRTTTYDAQLNPGSLNPTTDTTGISYYQLFTISTALLSGNEIHFDLYNTQVANCPGNRTCATDLDANNNAPFSHDAESRHSVPEPSTALLFGLGLVGGAFGLRRRATAD